MRNTQFTCACMCLVVSNRGASPSFFLSLVLIIWRRRQNCYKNACVENKSFIHERVGEEAGLAPRLTNTWERTIIWKLKLYYKSCQGEFKFKVLNLFFFFRILEIQLTIAIYKAATNNSRTKVYLTDNNKVILCPKTYWD